MADYATRRRVMVDTQVRPADVTRYPIIDAMLTVPREAFVPQALVEAAYAGEDIPIGTGRVILEPRTLAKMIEALDLVPGDLVLDVGAGLGYGAAVLSRLCEAVVAVEEDADLAADAQTALLDTGADNVAVITGALGAGAAQHGPYDAILVEGAVQQVPEAITAQLKDGGRIVALFLDGALGVCRVGWKQQERISWRDVFNAGAPLLPGFARPRAFVL